MKRGPGRMVRRFLGFSKYFVYIGSLLFGFAASTGRLQSPESPTIGFRCMNQLDEAARIASGAFLQDRVHIEAPHPTRSHIVSGLLAALAKAPAVIDAFTAVGGELHVSADARNICQAMRSEALVSYPPTYSRDGSICFVEDLAGGAVRIILPEDAEKVNREVLRVFGYWLVHHLDQLDADRRPVFDAFRLRLAESYLEDILDSQVFGLSGLAPLIGAHQKQEFEAVMAQGGSLLDVLSFVRNHESLVNDQQKRVRLGEFLNHVFVETFDSFYCNSDASYDEHLAHIMKTERVAMSKSMAAKLLKQDNTRAVLRDFFPRTHRTFLGFRRRVQTIGRD